MNDFTALGITPSLTEKLAERKILEPTAVQRMVIPPLLEGKSIIFRSATGTGKTFAYLLPALQRITAESANGVAADTRGSYRGPALVICAPTIELCSQIKTEADFLLMQGGGQGMGALSTKGTQKASAMLLTGSVNLTRQIDSLKKNKPLIAVGNPGRLLQLAKMGKLKFSDLRFLVLDEADRLTASDCREETEALMQVVAGYREITACEDGGDANQPPLTVAACSATVTEKIRECLLPLFPDKATGMASGTATGTAAKPPAWPPLLETDEHEILRERIEHWAIFSEGRRKTQTLISFFAAVRPKKVLVFTGRSYDAGKIVAVLQKHAIAAAGLYSGMDKKERKSAIDRFRSGKSAVLVSSDLAARGLDIPGITHIAALDVGESKDAYIHRAGRTGRAGKRGIMVSIGDEIEMRRLAVLEKKLGIKVCPKELYNGKLCVPRGQGLV